MLTIIFWAFMLVSCAIVPVAIGLRDFIETPKQQ